MKKIVTFLFISLVTVSFAQTKSTALPKEFYTCWKASYEENDDEKKIQVFRPCTNEFKPSMFRLDITFFANGKCKYYHAGPTDNHYYVDGTWTFNKKTRLITIIYKKKAEYKFKLIEVTKEVLKTGLYL